MSESCLFCRIASGEIPTSLVAQDDRLIAFKDINPQAPVHVLLVPRQHVASVLELQASDDGWMGHLMRKSAELARQLGIADEGFRVVVNTGPGAGQTVFHIHFHLLGGRALGWPPG